MISDLTKSYAVGDSLIELMVKASVNKNLVSQEVADHFLAEFASDSNFSMRKRSVATLNPQQANEYSHLLGLAVLATTSMQNFEATQNWVSTKDRYKEYILEKLKNSRDPQQTLEDLKKAKTDFAMLVTSTAHPDLFYPKSAVLFEGELSRRLQALAQQNNPDIGVLEGLIGNFAARLAGDDASLSHQRKVQVATEVELEERNLDIIKEYFDFSAWNEAIDEIITPDTRYAIGRGVGTTSIIPPSIRNLKGWEDLKILEEEKHLKLLTWNRSADADGRLLATWEALKAAVDSGMRDGEYVREELDLRDNSEIHSLFMNALCQALYRANPNVGTNGGAKTFRELCAEFGARHNLSDMGQYIYEDLTSEQKMDFMQMVVRSGALLCSDFKTNDRGQIELEIKSADGALKGKYIDFIHVPENGEAKPLLRTVGGERRPLSKDEADKLAEVFKRLNGLRMLRDDFNIKNLASAYEIANHESPEHTMELIIILIETGHIQIENGEISRVDILPRDLVETHEDFNGYKEVLDKMLSNPLIREVYRVAGRFEVMDGFSDGAKSCGSWASRWEVIKFHEDVAEIVAKHMGPDFPVVTKDGMGNGAYRGSTLEAGVYTMQRPLSTTVRNTHYQTWQSVQVARVANHETIGRNHVASSVIGTIDGYMRAVEAQRTPITQLDIDFRDATRAANDLIAEVSAKVYQEKAYDHAEIDNFAEGIPGNGNASSRSQSRAATVKTGVKAMRAVPYEYKALVADLDLLDVGLKEGLEALENNPTIIAKLVDVHAQLYPNRSGLSDVRKAYEVMMQQPFFSSQLRISEQSLRQTTNLEVAEDFAKAVNANGLFTDVKSSLEGAPEKISEIVRGIRLSPRTAHTERQSFSQSSMGKLKQMGQALMLKGMEDGSIDAVTKSNAHMAVSTLCAAIEASPRAQNLAQTQAEARYA